MSLEGALGVVNAMQSVGVISEYAIGGAIAAFLYIEPGTTFDLDIFVAWETGAGGLLDIRPIYGYLANRGYMPKGEAISVEGWDVQFLPANTPLVQEALQRSVPIIVRGVPTKVFTQEYLMAICLETARPKDLSRLVEFVQHGSPDETSLREILQQFGLEMKWLNFNSKYLSQ